MGCNESKKVEFLAIPKIQPRSHRSHTRITTRKATSFSTRLMSIIERYHIMRILGNDDLGALFQAREIHSGQLRTIREINKQFLSKNIDLLQEFNILRDIDHPNIIEILEAFETPRNFYIIMENISGGTLLDKYKRSGYEGEHVKHVHEFFSALNYIHQQGIIHCNLCPENAMLSTDDENAVLKIVGFNLAMKEVEIKDFDYTHLKIQYASPEILHGNVRKSTDIWSSGVMLYQFLTARYPFTTADVRGTIKEILAGEVDYENSSFKALSATAQDLVKSILVADPDSRPTCKDILEHEWFQESKKTLPITYNIAKKISLFHVETHIARSILAVIASKLSTSKNDFKIISYFKSLDLNNDGRVSREEIISVFSQAGLDVSNQIDFIMENLDYDQSGFIDYTELILALTNWPQELKKKNLRNVFNFKEDLLSVAALKDELPNFPDDEWKYLLRKTAAEHGKIKVNKLKSFLINQLS